MLEIIFLDTVRITCFHSCGHVYETKHVKKDMLQAYTILMTRKPQQSNTGILCCKSSLKCLRDNGNLHILVSLCYSKRKVRYLIHVNMSMLYCGLVQQLHLFCIKQSENSNKRLGGYLHTTCEISHMSSITTGH